MSDLQAIAAAYEQVDLHLQSLRDAEDRTGEEPAPEPADQEQRINDQAYFRPVIEDLEVLDAPGPAGQSP